MGSDNPAPPSGRLKARSKAQLLRACIATCAVVLLLYLTSDVPEIVSDLADETGSIPEVPLKQARGASLDAGRDFPTRLYTRQNSMLSRREDREVTGGSLSVQRDAINSDAKTELETASPPPEVIPEVTPKQHESYHGLFELSAVDIKGVPKLLSQYSGDVVLVVNVASACGYTETNYNGLRELYSKYHQRGFDVLAFPCNQFGQQEPGDNPQVEAFARSRGAEFPLFSKIEVNGERQHEVYTYLKQHLPGEISWNFNKFLVDRNGVPVKRYGPAFEKEELQADIEKYLDES